MIPISDDNPARLVPFVTWLILGGCIGVFVWQLGMSADAEDRAIRSLAFVPARLFGDDGGILSGTEGGMAAVWPSATTLTSMFLHGGLLHLLGNMLYLWIFGNNVEDAMGHSRFLFFYLVCGVVAALSQGIVTPTSQIPMIGASGAISGVLAAYVLIYPRARVTVIVPLGIIFYPMKISALFVVGFWFLLQLFSVAVAPPDQPGVAWWAHIGGFGAGAILTPLLSYFPLFGRHRRSPWR